MLYSFSNRDCVTAAKCGSLHPTGLILHFIVLWYTSSFVQQCKGEGNGRISKASITSQSENNEPARLLNWPSLVPMVPIVDLSLETILYDQILVIRNSFTSSLCKSYIAYLSKRRDADISPLGSSILIGQSPNRAIGC
jgi:hypothetical protein